MSPKASDLLKNTRRAPEILRCARETSQWPEIASAYLGFSALPYPSLLRLRRGDCIRLQELTDVKTFWQIFLRRVYRVEASDRVILDIGANVGLFSLYAARQAPNARILAVEPFPATFERLLQVVSEHHLTERITCLNCAITGEGGTRLMRSDPLPSQRRSLLPVGKSIGIPIQAKTLAELFLERDLNRVDLLKMDIEGGEYEVLLSTSPEVLRTIGRIALEYHGDCAPHNKVQIFDRLREAGFEVTWDVQDHLGYGVAEAVMSQPLVPASASAEREA
ncbi:MAG: FkbM family methyltransferase [Candidatus Sulfotelmatobacter sp.]